MKNNIVGCDKNATCYHEVNKNPVCKCNSKFVGNGTVCLNKCVADPNTCFPGKCKILDNNGNFNCDYTGICPNNLVY